MAIKDQQGVQVIAADASPLIALSKVGLIRLLQDLYGKVTIGPVVKDESVNRGKAIGAAGVEQIERALEEGWLRLAQPSAKERALMRGILKKTRLHEGEAELLAIARTRGLPLIVDDKEARAFASTLGVTYLGTVGVVLEAHLRHHVSFEELEEAVRELSRVMWLSPAIVAEILRIAREGKI